MSNTHAALGRIFVTLTNAGMKLGLPQPDIANGLPWKVNAPVASAFSAPMSSHPHRMRLNKQPLKAPWKVTMSFSISIQILKW